MNYHRKKHTTAKVMSVLLSVALLLSCMLPSTAWAAETGAYPNNWIVDWEATDGITIDEWVIDPEGFDDESYEDYEYEYDWDTPELYDDEAYAGDGIFPAFAPLDESARVVHEIRTAAEMASFLRGGIGGNDDHYIVMNNITMGTAGGDIFSGRGLDAEGRPFTGIFEGYSGLANPPV
ncbi:MAG: hypothetical protein FWD00_02905, partial [Clostridiales bacterium]|nr:hypothetical protein [Clostridiales bacterium]